MARVWPGRAEGFFPLRKIASFRLKLFPNGLLTGAEARTYIATTDGDAAALRRKSLGLLELLGACTT